MLKINKIYLKDFGTIIEETVTFEKVTVFSGENGQGKSTFLKAIYLNIFDVYEGTYRDYIRWGQKYFLNNIDFTLDGVGCKSEFDSQKGRKLTIGQKVYEGSDAKKVLSDLLPPKLTMAASVSQEHQIDVITTTPAQRREFLKSIYDLDFSEQIQSLLAEMEDFENKLEQYSREVTILDNKTYEVPEIPNLPFSDSEMKLKQKELDELNSKITLYETQKETYESKRESLSSFKETKEVLEDSLRSLKERKVNVEESISANKKRINSTFEIGSSLDKEKTFLNNLNQKKDKLVANPIKRPSRMLKRLSTKKKEDLLYKISELNSEKRNLESSLSRIEQGRCPECGRPYETKDKQKIKADLNTIEMGITSSNNNLQDEIQRLKDNDVKLTKQQEQNNKADLYEHDLKNVEEQIIEAEKSLKEQESLLREEHRKSVEESTSNLKMFEASLAEVKNKESDISDKIVNVTQNIDKFSDLTEPKKPEQSVYARVESVEFDVSQQATTEGRISSIKQMIESVEKQKKEDAKVLKENKAMRDKSQQEVNEYNEAVKILKTGLPQYILVKLTKAIEDLSNYFLDHTYEGRYSLRFIPSKDSLKLVYGAKDTVVKLASGYEQQVFSIAFKVALSNSGVNSRLLILDEADSASSIENSKKLYSFLGTLLDKFFDQYIIVTHKEEIKTILENELRAQILFVEDGRIITD